MITMAATTARVFAGLVIASVLAISIGVLVRYWQLFDRLVLPTVTLLSPVSPIAWLPVAIFLFGIGNAPAIFMVVVALFFHMVRSEEHTSELQSLRHLVCRLLLEKQKKRS